MLIRRGFDSDPLGIEFKRTGDVDFHFLNVWKNLRRLRNYCGIHVHQFPAAHRDQPRGFVKEHPAGRAFPARVRVREEMANIGLTQRSQNRVADGVHQDIGIGVSVESLRMWDFDSPENQLSPRDESVNVVTYSHVNHAREYRGHER